MAFEQVISQPGLAVYLRPLTPADVTNRYVSWLNDPHINRFLEVRFQKHTPDTVSQFVKEKQAADHEFLMAVCTLEDDLHIGNIKLGPVNRWHGHGDLSLLIGDRDYWGQGIATMAIQLMLDEAFYGLQLHKVTAGIYQDNKASLKAFQRNGFSQEGKLNKHFYLDGQWQDAYLMGLSFENYQRRVVNLNREADRASAPMLTPTPGRLR